MEKWAQGGREGEWEREGEATMEERKNCGEEKKEKEGKEGKVQNARILAKRCRSEERGRSGGKQEWEGGGNDTRLLTGTFFSSPTFLSGYI